MLAVYRHTLRVQRRDVRLRPSDIQDVVRDDRHHSSGDRASMGFPVDDKMLLQTAERVGDLTDFRFQQFSGETINEAITRHKLDAVKKLLATTDRPIKVISESCEYTDLAYLKTLFRRRFGCTMRDWHRQNHE